MTEVVVGRIGRPHGIRGEVSVEVRTDDPEGRFAVGSDLRTDPPEVGPLTIAAAKVHSGRLLLAFAGYTDRGAVELLRDTLLLAEVRPDDRPDDPDEFYDSQLVGLRVHTVEGTEVGTVAEMVHLPAQDLLAVDRPEGGEVLIPFVAELVPRVDLEHGVVLVDPPPGLLDDVPEEEPPGDRQEDAGDPSRAAQGSESPHDSHEG